MEITSNQIYNSIMHGAYSVIKNKEVLNIINVFPVRDGDTGSNLSSMMQAIIRESKDEGCVKKTLESIADAALFGARGNSGIIFAQYLNGLSESVTDDQKISVKAYARASSLAVSYACEAIEEPVEGTIITVMREWGDALACESLNKRSIVEIFRNAFSAIEETLEKTKDQLEVLRRANVVDSGAKGFTYFIEGVLFYLEGGKEIQYSNEISSYKDFVDIEFNHEEHKDEKYRYCTECLLEGPNINRESIQDYMKTKGDSLVVASSRTKCRIHVHTNEPAEVFNYLYNEGVIVYQKIEDMVKQKNIVSRQKSKIALVTDSIADLPQRFIDDHQIHIVNLDILFEERIYMDKMTIKPKRLLELSQNSKVLPTSSQPSPKHIENMFNYLSTYYDSAIVMTVSKELSGTYHNFKTVAHQYKDKFRIDVLNTKQNSVAQGLLVKRCAEFINNGYNHDEIIEFINGDIKVSKILVQVKTIDNMIKSGRLSVRLGSIAKRIGMKPIVTLDSTGNGGLESIAFSSKGSNKRVISHLKRLLKNSSIQSYAIVHVDNLIEAEELKNQVQSVIGFEPVYIEETSSIVAVGAGKGAVALAYILKEG